MATANLSSTAPRMVYFSKLATGSGKILLNSFEYHSLNQMWGGDLFRVAAPIQS
jgi:hypothetical protein